MRTLAPTIATSLLLAACGSAPAPIDTSDAPPVEETRDWQDWGKDENLARRVEGTAISGEEIARRLVGNTLKGCYANNEAFAETLTQDGKVLDPSNGAAVAQYAIQNDKLCFAYPQQQPACYTVTAKGNALYFYTAGGYRLVASTACPIPSGTKGLQ